MTAVLRKVSVLLGIYKGNRIGGDNRLRPIANAVRLAYKPRVQRARSCIVQCKGDRSARFTTEIRYAALFAAIEPMLRLNTKPEPIEIDAAKSAVVVVDMQNAFASTGGMLDIAGADISGAQNVVRRIATVLEHARTRSLPVVHLQMGYKPDQSNAGGPNSPNFHKELAMTLMNRRAELRGKLLTEGTWDFEIVEALKPRGNDLVVIKTRYSGFAGTPLDSMLRTRGIRYLFFAGIATNVCVESTLRDAYFLDYWPILLRDVAMAAGGTAAHDATVFNVENFFGWTLTSDDFLAALGAPVSRERSEA